MGTMGYMGESPAGTVEIPLVADSAVTGNSTITAEMNNLNVTNEGAVGAVIHTLPDAASVVGKEFSFTKVVAQDVTLQAAGSDVIADSVAGGTIANVSAETFAFMVLKSVSTGVGTAKWIIRTGLGTWTTA